MQSLIRVIALAYLIFITVLLLTEDPAGLIGMDERYLPLLRWLIPWAHLLSFLALAVLALSVRWPVPRWGVVLFIVLYAGITEILQGLLPPRTPEWQDWFMDLGGLAIGATLCWTMALLAGTISRARRQTHRPRVPSDQWEVVQKAMSRPGAVAQSWWC